nr:EOG090X03ST [Eurycercus lamellatus]
MDVGELLTFKPKTNPKRDIAEDGKELEVERPGKKQRFSSNLKPSSSKSSATATFLAPAPVDVPEREELLKLVEQDDNSDTLDENSLKRMILNFDKRVLKNQELRVKFPDSPEKFMDSELELHEAIQQLHALATVPELYLVAVEQKLIPTLLGLLSHDNSDIAVAVVNLLQELTDIDTLNESQEEAAVLIDALLDQQIFALLVHNLDRLNETQTEESDGVHNSLAIVENLSETRPEVCLQAAQQGLLNWILKRLRAKMPFDANKLYCSEILSILLQGTPENRQVLGEIDGIDILLQQLAVFKRQDPKTSEEHEMMENLFDSVCSSLIHTPNRDKFLKGEGLQLMNLMLREKKMSRNGALKVLNHALSGEEGKDNCAKFVDILGLRTIFPLFMKTPKKQKRKGMSAEECEEHVVSVIASMLKWCRGSQRSRLLIKFTENDHEKVDRLMELHFKYYDKVRLIDQEQQRRSSEEEDEDELYLKRLEGGLFTLQLVDYIMMEVCACGAPSVKQRVLHTLNLRGATVKTIREIMRGNVPLKMDALDSFDVWLSVKLKSLDTDENVFGDYIKGILEGEESQDEKIEALEGILAEISPTDGMTQNEICQEILKQWELYRAALSQEKSDNAVAVDVQIARIMEQQALCVVPQKKQTEEEKKLKQTILSQYAEVSDGEEDDEEDEADSGEERGLARNTNAEDVMKLEKIKKESLRMDSQKKKDKDKEDREKQKQLQLDRKEKEKKRTQKGEKKR